MGKRAKRKRTSSRSAPRSSSTNQEQTALQSFTWIPLWGWVLIFLLPLAFSEYMFYVAGRRLSMVLFLVAWLGFWWFTMDRSGWPILKRDRSKR